MPSFSIIGAGAWGTVIAKILVENGHDVTLWCYKSEISDQIQMQRHHRLPDISLPNGISATTDFSDCYDSDFVFLGLSSQQLVQYDSVIEWQRFRSPLVVLAKGLVEPDWFISRWLSARVSVDICVLSGPNLAYEIAQKKPAVTVLASDRPDIAEQLQTHLSNDYFRCYTSNDVIGVQCGGIFKNVFAIAAGCIEGLDLGANARSALITRGVLELGRIAQFFGGGAETVMGISGLGDLVATCSSQFSRNWQLGYQMVDSNTTVEWVDSARGETEGVRTIQLFYKTIVSESLNLPIMLAIGDVFVNNASPTQVIHDLMKRGLKSEF